MVDILAFGAHPDDIELGLGGILLHAASLGQSITLVDLTLGQKASNGTPKKRKQEALAAADILGAKRLFLNFDDCEVTDTHKGRLELVKVIRTEKPSLVLAPYWEGEMTHPDHTATGKLARNACRLARFPSVLPKLPIHRPQGILHYRRPGLSTPDFLFDITPHIEKWKEMISCHESQLRTLPYLQMVLDSAACLGTYLGTPYAQGLYKGNPIKINDPLTIAQGTNEL